MGRRKTVVTFEVLTLFPKMFEGMLKESLIGRAQESNLIRIRIHDLRNWSDDPKHQKIDDRPFGGGAGMVIKAEPVYCALKSLGALKKGQSKPWVVFMSPQGDPLKHKTIERLAKKKNFILICGHYEGIDERLMKWVDQEISIGDFVVTGGELPAMVFVDAVSRFVPGVIGDPESVRNDSFATGILDYSHYTRPSVWRGKKVPSVLLSGNHREIEQWRKAEAISRTKKKRPDLIN